LTSNAAGLANYPHARIAPHNASRTLYLSGSSSRQAGGSFAGAKTNSDGSVTLDIEEQTAAILRNIKAVINEVTGGIDGLEKIIDATVFLVDMQSHYFGMNAVWNRTWPDVVTAPARTTIAVRELPSPKMIIEIKCIGIIQGV
jgi:2-aminomuconate deaminase